MTNRDTHQGEQVSDEEFESAFQHSEPSGDAEQPDDASDLDENSDVSPVIGVEEYMGHGYDGFGGEATADAVRKPIFDLISNDRWVHQPTVDKSMSLSSEQLASSFNQIPPESKLINRRPSKVHYAGRFKADWSIDDIKTESSNTTSWGVGGEIGGTYMGFSASVKARFDESMSRLASTQIVTVWAKMLYWTLNLDGYGLVSAPPILPNAREDFEKLPVAQLMDAYGTHCIMSCGIGTKIAFHYMADTSKFNKGMDLKASLSASYTDGADAANVKLDAELHEKINNDRTAIQARVEAEGFSDEQLEQVELEQGAAKHPMRILKQGWHNPALIELPQGALKPIWKIEGLMEAQKADEFESEYKKRFELARSQMNDLFSGYQPLYLFSWKGGELNYFRFAPHSSYTSPDGNVWKNVLSKSDGSGPVGGPWLLIESNPKEGHVPLFEYAFDNKQHIVRYETEHWAEIINQFYPSDLRWTKTTSQPLGYVRETPINGGEMLTEGYPIYCFSDASGHPSRGVFYSAMKELLWENGRFKPISEESLAMTAVMRREYAKLNSEWDGKDFFYKLSHTKPTLGTAVFQNDGSPQAQAFFTVGIPHWYAADCIVKT